MRLNTSGWLLAALLGAAALPAQASQCAAPTDTPYPAAAASNPTDMGWMQGSPPPENRRVQLADGSFFRFPALRYSVRHMSEFLPVTRVSRRNTAPMALSYALSDGLTELAITPWGSDTPLNWEQMLAQTYTDGLIVLHKGQVVYETYRDDFKDYDLHLMMSMTKAVAGTLALDLVKRGKLDENQPVSHYIPELAESGFGDATVGQVLNMTTGIDFDEHYADPKSEIWAFSAAGNPLPKPKGYKGPHGYYEYLPQVRKLGKHGEGFTYRTANTEVAGWLVARVTGMSVADYLEERIWSRIGMERAAQFQVDALGTPFSGGGLNASLRDLARFGELMRNNGKLGDEQILHPDVVPDIRSGAHYPAFAQPLDDSLADWSFRSMWWATGNEQGAFMARGVHGQSLYIDPENEIVIARFASHPIAANAANDCISLPAYQAIIDHLSDTRHP
ncbi:serine hydrolase domain-containing protein [Marinobacterium weihaiense]|uniref:Beta-lactamase family protein n=1 Tax=Marinobacterium weihaiense TaxID=2851016 RepID=A0ABS6MDY2_9GAMM|nr:serine hydrolase [Marinobacterium weihaiense]MBV0934365.1 beta-lactamase family protein [Marinobacterium weihaiense]